VLSSGRLPAARRSSSATAHTSTRSCRRSRKRACASARSTSSSSREAGRAGPLRADARAPAPRGTASLARVPARAWCGLILADLLALSSGRSEEGGSEYTSGGALIFDKMRESPISRRWPERVDRVRSVLAPLVKNRCAAPCASASRRVARTRRPRVRRERDRPRGRRDLPRRARRLEEAARSISPRSRTRSTAASTPSPT